MNSILENTVENTNNLNKSRNVINLIQLFSFFTFGTIWLCVIFLIKTSDIIFGYIIVVLSIICIISNNLAHNMVLNEIVVGVKRIKNSFELIMAELADEEIKDEGDDDE